MEPKGTDGVSSPHPLWLIKKKRYLNHSKLFQHPGNHALFAVETPSVKMRNENVSGAVYTFTSGYLHFIMTVKVNQINENHCDKTFPGYKIVNNSTSERELEKPFDFC